MCRRVHPEHGGRGERSISSTLSQWKENLHRLVVGTIDPQDPRYVVWLVLVAASFAYNAWTPLLRVSFWHRPSGEFLTADIISDIINVIDVIVFKPRHQISKSGCPVRDLKLTAKAYIKTKIFRLDLIALIPIDYAVYGYQTAPLLRLNRMTKLPSYTLAFRRLELIAKFPFVFVLCRTVSYMAYLMHFNACAYYVISRIEGIGSNTFVYQGKGKLPYIRCFYFSFKTAAGIGKNSRPTHEPEYLFMAFLWLQGSFIFAFILGQIKDIVATAVRGKTEYQESLDKVVQYMVQMEVPKHLDEKVRRYLVDTYATKKTLQEDAMLGVLPSKLRQEIVKCEQRDIGVKLY